MEQVFPLLDGIGPLDDGLRDYFRSALKTTRPGKDTILVKEGSVARTIGFIEKGLIRGFRTEEDSEHTSWFMKEGDVFCSVKSFFTQTPANETVQTIEPCIIHSLTFDQYKYSYTKYPYFNLHRAELLLKYYLMSLEREEMRQQGAYERICYLMEHYPDLEKRVADKYLASFLSLTPAYYSNRKNEYVARNGRP